MDCQLSCTSPLPWVWVIEALARSNQVDVSLLIDLLEKTPEIPNDVGKNAREMVSLRILENFSVEGARANSVSSARSPKIRLDPSQSCEDVLRRILSETSASNLKNAASEMRKWDVQPFIQHKRSSSAKYALQQLKAAILTGSNSLLASLRVQSGLSVGNSPEHGAPADNGNLSDITPRGEGRDANGSYVVHKDPPVENLQPVSRKRRITTDNSAGESCKQQITLKNGCKTRGKFVGKSKHDNVGSEHDIGGKLISSGVDTTLVDNNEFTSSKGLVGPDEALPHEKEVPHSDTELSNKSVDEQGQDDDIEEAKGDKEGFRESETINEDVDKLEQNNNQRDAPNIGEVEEDDISSDDDGNNDDRADVVTKNNASCQPANSPGASAAPNWGYLSLLADASKRVAQDSGEDKSGSGGKSHAGGTGQNGRPGDGHNKCTSLKGLVHHDEVLPNEKQAPLCGTEMLNDKFDGEWGQDHDFENVMGGKRGLFTVTHENMDKLEQNIQRNIPNVVEGGEDVDLSSDSDGYHEERTIIDTKKKTFLSSQCTYSQESLAMTDWRELNLCMKCNKSGKLLVCSSNSCPIVIHESCLGSAASFDTSGKFYCPFCAYSRAISRYTAIRKKSALARKDLAIFIGSGTRKESKRRSRKPCNEPNNRDFAKKPSNHQCRKKLEYEHAGPSTLNSGSTSKDKQEGKKTRQASQSPRVHGQHHKAARAIRKSLSDMSVKHAEIRSKKGVLCPPEKDLRHESECSSADAEEASEEEREHVFVSKYFTRVKKERKYLYPAIPLLRRKNLPWTRAEEEKLKEAMQKICSPHDKVIPWKKILEFGEGTFDRSRNTIDLKDKWRNVCKAIKKFSSDDELAQVS